MRCSPWPDRLVFVIGVTQECTFTQKMSAEDAISRILCPSVFLCVCVCVCMHVACVCVCVLTSHEKVHNISCSGSSLREGWKKLNSSQWEGSELGGELNRWRKWILYFVFHIFAFHISIFYFVFLYFLFLQSWWIKQAAEVNLSQVLPSSWTQLLPDLFSYLCHKKIPLTTNVKVVFKCLLFLSQFGFSQSRSQSCWPAWQHWGVRSECAIWN